jgi:hypothetical protein
MFQRVLLGGAMVAGIVLVAPRASAQCKPGQSVVGSAGCGASLSREAPVLGSDVFYSDPKIFPTPPVFGPLYSQPGVALLPPPLPSWYFQPLYLSPPTQYVGPGSSLYSAPPTGLPSEVRPEGTYSYPSPRALETPIPSSITPGGSGVWTAY